MVEGPGCKLKGEKIRAKLLKQAVKSVKGNAVYREEKLLKKKSKSSSNGSVSLQQTETPFHRLVGQSLDELLTLGKELFMFFGNSCLRIHFLMAGSFRVNNELVDKDGGRNVPDTPILEVQFCKDTLTFYKCAAEIRPSSACRQKYSNLKDLDICSLTFNPKRAVTEMMIEQERQLCDVLLDQDVLPGVGNIIKNEALFDSGLKPDTKIKDLCEEHITHLVKMTRDFSMVFYKCRKNGTNLRQFMKVYHKGKCGECESKVVTTRMGDDSPRVTYFCPVCQTNDLKKGAKLKLPSKNSLLGWVQTGQNTVEEEEWSCSQCTLINLPTQSNCSVCLSPRIGLAAHSSSSSVPLFSGIATTADSSEANRKKLPETFDRRAANPALPTLSRNNPLRSFSETTKLSNSSPVKRKTQLEKSDEKQCDAKRSKRDAASSGSRSPRGTDTEASIRLEQTKPDAHRGESSHSREGDVDSKIALCLGHKTRCAMRQTFKDNENKGRWFFVCAANPANKRCNFFQWADERFPRCPGHNKASALRTVMKQGPNNGRRFFCCPLRKNSCSFFEWALGYG